MEVRLTKDGREYTCWIDLEFTSDGVVKVLYMEDGKELTEDLKKFESINMDDLEEYICWLMSEGN